MRLTIQREPLLAALSKLMPLPVRASTNDAACHRFLRFTAEQDEVQIEASDSEMHMVARTCAHTLGREGRALVPAHKLHDIVRALDDGAQVNLSVAENEWVMVSSGKSSFRLASLPESSLMTPTFAKEATRRAFTLPARAFRSMLDTAACSIERGVNLKHRAFSGVLLELLDDRARCVACDGRRLSRAEHGPIERGEAHKLVLPRKTLQMLQHLLADIDEDVTVSMHEHYLRVRTRTVTLTSRVIDSPFPNYEAAIPINADTQVLLERNAFLEVLQRAAIGDEADKKGLVLNIGDEGIEVRTLDAKQLDVYERMDAQVQPQGAITGPFRLGILPRQYDEALRTLTSKTIRLLLRDAYSAVQIVPDGSDATLHVIMPVRS